MTAALMDHRRAAHASGRPHPALDAVLVERWTAGSSEPGDDMAAAEIPVSLEYNGISHAVMLASPGDLEDFALGFSLTESIIAQRRDLRDLEVVERENGIQIRLRIAEPAFQALRRRRRGLAGRTGCGLCGTESLSQVFRPIPPITSAARVSPTALQRAFRHMSAAQSLQRLTGATHAAGWVDAHGDLTMVREDVGRHNALDKLVGALAAAGEDLTGGAVVITSRASSEMVQKTASVGIGILAAISAPTLLAIRMAEALDLTLVGFVRRNRHVLYAGGQRIVPGETP